MKCVVDKERAFIISDCRKKGLTLTDYFHQHLTTIPHGTLYHWVEKLLKQAYMMLNIGAVSEDILSVLEDFTYCVVKGKLKSDIQKFFAIYLSDTQQAQPMQDNTPTIEDIIKDVTTCEEHDTDEYATKTFIERDADGKISKYLYTIWRRNKSLLEGALSREEMALIYRMYSSYGDGLTQATVSRSFTNLSLCDFKRILRAFNITKASAPFAPHQIEEMSEEEMRRVQLREKENNILRCAEEDRIKNDRLLLNKYIKKNRELEEQLRDVKEFQVIIDASYNIPKREAKVVTQGNKHLLLYLSDMHLGATVTSGTLYEENIDWGTEEAARRLLESINILYQLGRFDFITIVLLGDQIDCSGIQGLTARGGHFMPENMDPKEQINAYIHIMLLFITTLTQCFSDAEITVYSVPNGNHDGAFGYAANKTVLTTISKCFPDITCELWEHFYGTFSIDKHTFICFHGQDERYHKQPLPLVLNDNTKIKLYEWLHYNNIQGEHIHFIKGDLHSSNIESCMRLDYRNVLSLFGASDYSSMNYSRNSYGLSYDIINNGILLRGDIVDV